MIKGRIFKVIGNNGTIEWCYFNDEGKPIPVSPIYTLSINEDKTVITLEKNMKSFSTISLIKTTPQE